jgi:hypothetical protein
VVHERKRRGFVDLPAKGGTASKPGSIPAPTDVEFHGAQVLNSMGRVTVDRQVHPGHIPGRITELENGPTSAVVVHMRFK